MRIFWPLVYAYNWLKCRIAGPREIECVFTVSDDGVELRPPKGFVIQPGETVRFGASIPAAYIHGSHRVEVHGQQEDGSPAHLRIDNLTFEPKE